MADGNVITIPLFKLDEKSRLQARSIAKGGMKTGEATLLEVITNSIGMKLVLIPAGTFTMGSPAAEAEWRNNETQHEVTISKSYYLGVYEVTQDQYGKVMGNNPSEFKGATNPAEQVSWEGAVSFCNKLSKLPEEKAAGREYRLPTEAAVGSSTRRFAGRRSAARSTRRTVRATSASAWP